MSMNKGNVNDANDAAFKYHDLSRSAIKAVHGAGPWYLYRPPHNWPQPPVPYCFQLGIFFVSAYMAEILDSHTNTQRIWTRPAATIDCYTSWEKTSYASSPSRMRGFVAAVCNLFSFSKYCMLASIFSKNNMILHKSCFPVLSVSVKKVGCWK